MKNKTSEKTMRIARRHARIRAKISGTKERPRLYVFKSNQHVYAQLIDDEAGKTMAGFSDLKLKKSKDLKKSDRAKEVGRSLAEIAKGLNIQKIVFDRGGYKFHGRIKQLAEGAREGGLKF